MATYVFIDDQERDYSDIDGHALRATPGQEYDLASDPGDGRWQLKDGTAKAAPVVTAPDPELEVTEPEGA